MVTPRSQVIRFKPVEPRTSAYPYLKDYPYLAEQNADARERANESPH